MCDLGIDFEESDEDFDFAIGAIAIDDEDWNDQLFSCWACVDGLQSLYTYNSG